jgi:hypothetical protein
MKDSTPLIAQEWRIENAPIQDKCALKLAGLK